MDGQAAYNSVTVFFQMNQPKPLKLTINGNQKEAPQKKQVPQIEGMIAMKKIEHYSYALTDEIGLGYSSHVYKGKNDLTNEMVAVKVIDMRKEDELHKQFISGEIAALEAIKKINAPHLLALHDVLQTKNNIYIVTEFCEGKDMAKILRKRKTLTESEAQSVMNQLLKGYAYIYRLGIIHRDLKLANVFIKGGEVKLADFGFAIKAENCQQAFSYNVGSPYYMPPETLKTNRYSFKSDVWAMGVIAFELFYGYPPWKDKNEDILFQKINQTSIEDIFDRAIPISDCYKQFILKCLQMDYNLRCSPEAMIDHRWDKAMEYVEGFDLRGSLPKGNSKPVQSYNQLPAPQVISTQVTSTQLISEEEYKRARKLSENRLGQGQKAEQGRKFENSIKAQVHLPEKIVRIRSQEESNQLIETALVGQIHYCRFLNCLCEGLEGVSLPEGSALRSQIIGKIIGKMELLQKQGENNLFELDGFTQYSQRQKWPKLKQLIQNCSIRFHEKYKGERMGGDSDDVVLNSIKFLSADLSRNFTLLEELVYYWQLKKIERRQNIYNFAISTKIDMLASKRVPLPSDKRLEDRLVQKLRILGI